MTNQRRWLIVGGLVVLIALGVAYAFYRLNQPSTPVESVTVPDVIGEQAASGPTLQQLEQIEQALSSSDTATQTTVLSDEFAQAFAASGQPLMPAGATVTMQPETLTSNDTFGQVVATLTQASGEQQEFILSLQNQNGSWKVFLIEEKR